MSHYLGYGNFSVEVPQDRKSTFAPQIIPKRQKNISGIDRKIISMYGRGLSTRQISDTIEELYGFEVSDASLATLPIKFCRKFRNGKRARSKKFIR